MFVAPSFKDFERVGEPFDKDGKQYIRVRNPKTGKERDVRYYTEKEFKKAYPKEAAQPVPGLKKHNWGFDNGFVIAARGYSSADDEWLKNSGALWGLGLGYIFQDYTQIPADIPPTIKFAYVEWEEVRDGDDDHIKPGREIDALIRAKIERGEPIKPDQE